MLYFAYGSNMDWDRLRGRCPSARFVCVAKLPKYKLSFTHKCTEGHGVSDIVPNDDSVVWGVVYQVDELDVGRLDKREGYRPGREKNSYRRQEIRVEKDGDEEQPHTVSVYIVMEKEDPCPKPSAEYKRYIVEGAKFWHLPDDYIREKLEAIEVKPANG